MERNNTERFREALLKRMKERIRRMHINTKINKKEFVGGFREAMRMVKNYGKKS